MAGRPLGDDVSYRGVGGDEGDASQAASDVQPFYVPAGPAGRADQSAPEPEGQPGRPGRRSGHRLSPTSSPAPRPPGHHNASFTRRDTVTTSHPYVRYRMDLERPFPDEEQLIRQIVGAMESASRQVAAKHRHGLRDAHAKSHGILAGELRIEPDLPEHLAQGLFAAPRSYPVIVRFSPSPGDLRSDQVPVLRGLAIKVIGANGPRAIDDGATTQDFLLVNHPTLPFGTIGEYAKLQKLLDQQLRQSDLQQRVTRLRARVAARVLEGLGRPLPPVIEGLATANNHILGETFHSMAALRYGDHVAKISAAPWSEDLRALSGRPVDRHPVDSAIRDLIADFF